MDDDTHRTEDPAPPRRPRLVRRTDGRVLGGVAGGMADHFGVDPLVPRLVFAGLALYGGLGVLVYLVCWAVIPADQGQDPAAGGAGGTVGRAVGIVLLVLAGLLALRVVGRMVGLAGSWPPVAPWLPGPWPRGLPMMPDLWLWPLRPSILVAVLLIVLGIALYRSGGHGGGPRSSAASQSPPAPAVPPPPGPQPMRAQGPAPAPARVPPAPSRPPSMLGRLTLALALTITGAAALGDRAGVVELGVADLLALAMTIVGVGLMVGAWWGRARWLIAVGFGLLPFVLVAALVPSPPWGGPLPLRGAAADQFHQPADLEELRPTYGITAGRLVLDLSALDLPDGEEVAASVDVTAGQIEVVLPPDADTLLSARALVGSVRFPDREAAGLVMSEEALVEGDGTGGLLRLDLSVTAGEIQVRRHARGEPPPAESSSTWERPGAAHATTGSRGGR